MASYNDEISGDMAPKQDNMEMALQDLSGIANELERIVFGDRPVGGGLAEKVPVQDSKLVIYRNIIRGITKKLEDVKRGLALM